MGLLARCYYYSSCVAGAVGSVLVREVFLIGGSTAQCRCVQYASRALLVTYILCTVNPLSTLLYMYT